MLKFVFKLLWINGISWISAEIVPLQGTVRIIWVNRERVKGAVDIIIWISLSSKTTTHKSTSHVTLFSSYIYIVQVLVCRTDGENLNTLILGWVRFQQIRTNNSSRCHCCKQPQYLSYLILSITAENCPRRCPQSRSNKNLSTSVCRNRFTEIYETHKRSIKSIVAVSSFSEYVHT